MLFGRRRSLEIAVVGLVFLSGPANAEFKLKIPKVTIRATSAIPVPVIKYIAGVSVPQQQTIPAGMQPELFLRSFCGGSLTDAFQEKFYELNKQLERMPVNRPRDVMMPACVQWRKDPLVPVRSSDTIDSIIKREIGADPDSLLSNCTPDEKNPRCNRTIREVVQQLNPGVDLTNLKAVNQIRLPVTSKYTTFSVDSNPDEVVQAISDLANAQRQAGVESIIDVSPAVQDIELIAPLSIDKVQSSSVDCKDADKDTEQAWPFNVDDVAAALERSQKALLRRSIQLNAARVVVLDTGLALPSQVIPDLFLNRNAGDHPGDNRDNDGNGFVDDHYGIDALGRGRIGPHNNYDHKAHGLYVADLSTGGRGMRRRLPNLHHFLTLKVVHVVSQSSDGFEIRDSAILKGVHFAGGYADIVNMSVGSTARLDAFERLVSTTPHLLFIVAAGNEGKDLSFKPIYPAVYGGAGGTLTNQVITVAAHGKGGKLADFSNVSDDAADIAAPGCAITQLDYSNSEVRNFGTSLAAPLVTFTAALLRSLGLQTPREIKDRILSSARYVPSLRGLVSVSGTLDVAKAVSLYEDVVETTLSPKAKFGRWVRPADVKLCSNLDLFDADQVKKITYIPTDQNPLRILYRTPTNRIKEFRCQPAGTGIKMQIAGESGEVEYTWQEFRDLVPGRRLN